MPDVERYVVRLEDVPARRVERARQLRQLQECLEIGHRPVPAHSVDAHERRPLCGRENHVVAPDDEVARRITGTERKPVRRVCGLGAQEAWIEADAGVVDRLAGRAKELERPGMVEQDTDLGGETVDAGVDRRERLLPEGLEPRQAVHEHVRPSSCNSSCMMARAATHVNSGAVVASPIVRDAYENIGRRSTPSPPGTRAMPSIRSMTMFWKRWTDSSNR